MSYMADATKALFFQTGAYDRVGLRPMTHVAYSQDIATSLYEHTKHGSDLSVAAISPVASELLTLQTEACGVANLINGFDTHRFRFFIEFTEQPGLQATSGKTRTVFVGYTDYTGATMKGNIDKNMKLFFNNAVQLREVTMNTPMGPRTQVNVSYSNQLLHNPMAHDYMMGSPQLMTLRPEDLFALMQYENQAEFSQLAEFGAINVNALSSVTANARSNMNPAVYLSNTMQSFKTGMNAALSDSNADFDLGEAYSTARTEARTSLAGSRTSVLRSILAQTNFAATGYVTYGEMEALFPSFGYIADFKLVSSNAMGALYQPGQGGDWLETSDNAWLASQLQMSVPAIMNDSMLQYIHIFATNDTIGGVWDVRPVSPAKSMVEGLDQTPQFQLCMNRIVNEVLKPITHSGLMKLMVNMRVDLFGDATYAFNFDNRGEVSYTAPSFCDALYSSLLTTNTQNLVGLKTDIETMLHDITGDVGRMARESQMQNRTFDPSQHGGPQINFGQAVDLSSLLNGDSL